MSNMKAMEVPKGVKKENGIKTIFENVSKLMKDSKLKCYLYTSGYTNLTPIVKKLNRHSYACS